MVSAKRILGAFAVLAIIGYIALEFIGYATMKSSFDQADGFCTHVKPGTPANMVIALAKSETSAKSLSVEADGLLLRFNGGCHCRIAF